MFNLTYLEILFTFKEENKAQVDSSRTVNDVCVGQWQNEVFIVHAPFARRAIAN